jgi:hypothetical protein
MQRNGVTAGAEPRLSLCVRLDLAILSPWIAMAVFIIVGASAGKQARILIRYHSNTAKIRQRLF